MARSQVGLVLKKCFGNLLRTRKAGGALSLEEFADVLKRLTTSLYVPPASQDAQLYNTAAPRPPPLPPPPAPATEEEGAYDPNDSFGQYDDAYDPDGQYNGHDAAITVPNHGYRHADQSDGRPQMHTIAEQHKLDDDFQTAFSAALNGTDSAGQSNVQAKGTTLGDSPAKGSHHSTKFHGGVHLRRISTMPRDVKEAGGERA